MGEMWSAVSALATVLALVAAVWSTVLSRRDAREARTELAAREARQLLQDLAQVIGYWEVDEGSTAEQLRLAVVVTNRSQHVVENVSALKEDLRVHFELLLPGETRRAVGDYNDVAAPLVRRFQRGSIYLAFLFGGKPWEKTTEGLVLELESNELRPR